MELTNETMMKQHLQYEPYGGGWVDERTDEARSKGFSSRYRFTGKERDAESCLDYFGARYYWSGGGLWLSVDPLADNYPFLSPYVYGACSPVVLVDADGREVIYGSLRDRINSWFAWLISSDYRKRWCRWKESEDWYLLRRKEDKPVLIEAGASKLSEGLYLVEYSGIGITGSEPLTIDLRGKKKEIKDYTILCSSPEKKCKWNDHAIIEVRNAIPGTQLSIDALDYPDIFTFKDKEGNVFEGPFSLVKINAYPYEGAKREFYKYRIEKDKTDFIIEVKSRYNWSGGPDYTPSSGRIIYYRYRFPGLKFTL